VGKFYRIGTVEISRGCPLICTYCINSYLPQLTGVHNYVTKSVDRAIKEMVYLVETYSINFFRFLDEIFLLKDLQYLEELADAYVKHVNLPFIVSTTATSVKEDKMALLKKMGCVNVGLGVETGNEEYRKTVLKKRIPNSHYERAYRWINAVGIRSTAQIMFGLPGETKEDLINAIRLVKRWNVETAHVATFYPYKGTTLRDYCIEHGFLTEKDIEEYEKDRFISTKIGQSVLEFDEQHYEDIQHYKTFFSIYKEVPEWLWPMVDKCAKDGAFSKELTALLRELVAQKRFG
jgi:anaerobic magnesium-protoporphyrin IX monomethyl ester cyclase